MQGFEGDVAFFAFLEHQVIVDGSVGFDFSAQGLVIHIDGIVHGSAQEVGAVDDALEAGAFAMNFYIILNIGSMDRLVPML